MPKREGRRGLLLASLAATQLVIILDLSIVILALPSIGRDLGMEGEALQWVINAYALAFGGALLLGGRAADLFGRGRVFLLGLAAFTLASLAAGLSPSAGALVAARALQGLGAAVASSAALSIVAATFSGPERERALGVWGALGGVGGAAGALLGGFLTSGPGWEWVFFVNVPVGALILVVTPFLIPPDVDPRAMGSGGRGLDPLGALTATGGIVALVYAVVATGTVGLLSGQTLAALVAAAVLLSAFVRVERRAERDGRVPLVRLGIFRKRELAAANLLALPVGTGPLAVFFVLSLYTQRGLGWSPLESGVAVLPAAFALVATASQASTLMGRFGLLGPLVAGLLLLASGLLMLSRVPADGSFLGDLLLPEIVVGVGLGLSLVVLPVAAVSGVGAEESGLASGLINTTLQFGGSVGLAALAAIAAAVNAGVLASDPSVPEVDALVAGYRAAFALGSGVAFVGAVLAFPLLGRRRA